VRNPSSLIALLREIGGRVRAARESRGLTQEEAAHAAGIDYKRWQRLEQGTVNPTVKTLERAAQALGSSFWNLVRAKARTRRR
jgi:transcriptional regulator with XRE-family HTH domain